MHAFWSSRPLEDPRAPFAIEHSILAEGEWSPPQEIVLSPSGDSAVIARAAVDANNRLHLFWVVSDLIGDLYYASAAASEANAARAWSTPQLVESQVFQEDVMADASGNIHLVYASQAQGVCHRVLKHTGAWTEPSCLETCVPLRGEEYDTRPRLALDSRGGIHVVWVVSDLSAQSVLAYAGRAICYARSVDGGVSWSRPRVIDSVESRESPGRAQPEYPAIKVDVRDWVHIVWIGQNMHRYHTWSEDRGLTWAEPQVAVPLGGYNNWMGLAASAEGTLHLVTAHLQGLAYSRWDGMQWSTPLQFPDTRGAHYADALACPDGSVLAVWQDHGGGRAVTGHILYDHLGECDTCRLASGLAPEETPQPTEPTKPAAQNGHGPSGGDGHSPVERTQTAAQTSRPVLLPLWWSVISASCVVVVALYLTRWRRAVR